MNRLSGGDTDGDHPRRRAQGRTRHHGSGRRRVPPQHAGSRHHARGARGRQATGGRGKESVAAADGRPLRGRRQERRQRGRHARPRTCSASPARSPPASTALRSRPPPRPPPPRTPRPMSATVASATDELSGSIAEIGRQAASVRRSPAARWARPSAPPSVGGLAEAAQKIGDVVRLISDDRRARPTCSRSTPRSRRRARARPARALPSSPPRSRARHPDRQGDRGHRGPDRRDPGGDRRRGPAIGGIGKTIAEISGISAAIAAAVEEQGAATREIARNVQQAAEGTNQVSSNIAGVRQAADQSRGAGRQCAGRVRRTRSAGQGAVRAASIVFWPACATRPEAFSYAADIDLRQTNA